MDIQNLIMKNKKLIALAVLAVLLMVYAPQFGLQILSPGPEGVDVKVYGVQDSSLYASDSSLHLTSETPGGTRLSEWHVSDPNYGWCDYVMAKPDPYNCLIRKNYYWQGKTVPHNSLNYLMEVKRPELVSPYESNIRGDPLGISRAASEIVWHSWETEPTESGNEVEWTKYGAYLVPCDAVIQLSCRADIDGSYGWTKDLNYWLVIDTVRWYNAFSDAGQLQPAETPEDAVLLQHKFKGAFPFFAWISEWDPFVIEDENGEEWKTSDIPSEINDYTQVYPSLEGRQIPLYTSPDTQYTEILSSDVWKDPTLITGLENKPGLPDPRFAETVYTPITLTKFGALKQSGGFLITYWEKFYYPTCFIRVRLLYLVWGEWTYLWTQEEAEKQDYEWKERSSVIHVHDSLWDQFWGGVGGWFANPFNQLWLFMVLIVIVVVAVSFASPGLWTKLAMRRRQET